MPNSKHGLTQKGDTMASIAQRILGDARLTHEIEIPAWHGEGEVPEGYQIQLKGVPPHPPSRQWTKPR